MSPAQWLQCSTSAASVFFFINTIIQPVKRYFIVQVYAGCPYTAFDIIFSIVHVFQRYTGFTRGCSRRELKTYEFTVQAAVKKRSAPHIPEQKQIGHLSQLSWGIGKPSKSCLS